MHEILMEIESYLSGATTDRALERWVVGNLQRILDSKQRSAIKLMDTLDVAFLDFDGELIDDIGLRAIITSLHHRAKLVRYGVRSPRRQIFDFGSSTTEVASFQAADDSQIVRTVHGSEVVQLAGAGA